MLKKCTKCGAEKPLTTEFFHRGKDTKEGFKSACKECRNADKSKWREANKDRVNQQAKEYHINNREKELERRRKYHQENREARLEYSRQYYINNKEKKLEYGREWNKRNPEKRREYRRRYVEKNIEKVREADKHYRENNKEKIRIRDKKRRERPEVREFYRLNRLRPEVKEQNKAYKKSERGRQANKRHKHKRRQLERNSIVTLSLTQWNDCKKHFNEKCAYCGEKDKDLTQEHFVPVIKGGEYTFKNIIPACGSCNSSKCDKDFFVWYPKQGFYSERQMKKILKYLDIQENQQQIAFF